ncbi:MAG: leucyl aminopeptidase family protein [Gammaproteobacteria bacterium]|nr:leucyl aminopeptidase family protein [Gammaproteobacteria bacterium]
MTDCFTSNTHSTPIICLTAEEYGNWLTEQNRLTKNWLKNTRYKAKPNSISLVPDRDGAINKIVLGVADHQDMWNLAALPKVLPEGNYQVDKLTELQALAWGLGHYQFNRYQSNQNDPCLVRLFTPQTPSFNLNAISTQIEAITLARDMINTPASDMMPQDIAIAAQTLAKKYSASIKQIVGDELLKHNYPTIHAVGRASVHAPRLIDMQWGNAEDKKITLIGKGVCFDSGGLDMKSAKGMRWMKKDMGGAAHVLGLAQMIMAEKLPVRLRVLIPAVENAISDNAFRPGDIITTRSGKTVEIDNTDAEGRLVLCDALTEAASEKPTLIIDFATLTGAARAAVGTEVAAFFSNNSEIAAQLMAQSDVTQDPAWQLPLHKPYRAMLNSTIADITNSAGTGYGGAITAALYLQEFINKDCDWLHFDVMAFNTRQRAGRPKGGEALGLRAAFGFIANDL